MFHYEVFWLGWGFPATQDTYIYFSNTISRTCVSSKVLIFVAKKRIKPRTMKPTTEQRSEIISEMLRVRPVLMSWCAYLGMEFPSRSACRVNRQVQVFSFPLWAAHARASSASPRARVRRFSFFTFTSSPAVRNSFVHSAIRVKAFVLRPSRFASLSSEKAQCYLSCFEICINAGLKLPIRVKGLVKIRVKGKGPFCEKPSPLTQ